MNTALPFAADGRVDFDDCACATPVTVQSRAVASRRGFIAAA
jgi:hypothetical protein